MENPIPAEAQKQSLESSSSPPPQASLLGLPRELRNKIYRSLLNPEEAKPQNYRYTALIKNELPWPVGRLENILYANKQLRAEVYDENMLCISSYFLKFQSRQAALACAEKIKFTLHFSEYKIDTTDIIEFRKRYPEAEPVEWFLRVCTYGPRDSIGLLEITEDNGRVTLRSVHRNPCAFLYLCRKKKDPVEYWPEQRGIMEDLKMWTFSRESARGRKDPYAGVYIL